MVTSSSETADTSPTTTAAFPEALADRYRRFKYRSFGPNIEHYRRLATLGQNPRVMLISCSDSRVDPETIFSSMPGELFIMRNVANLVPPFETGGQYHGVSAALEYAVLNLKVDHIIVMGHQNCGGVKACLNHAAAVQTEAHFITGWISMLDGARDEILAKHQDASEDEQQQLMEYAAVVNSIRNLRTFPFVREAEERGDLSLHGAHFEIEKGELRAFDEASGEFVTL